TAQAPPAAASSSSTSRPHSDAQRSAISISSSKWNAAMSSNKRTKESFGARTSNSGGAGGSGVGGGAASGSAGGDGDVEMEQQETTSLIKLAYLNVDQFYALQNLMRQHGDSDWAMLGQLMGIRPADLAKNWDGYSVNTRVTRQWTKDEMELLATCRQMGICCRTTAKIIGTKLPLQCRRKTLKPPLDVGPRNSRVSLRRAISPAAAGGGGGGGGSDSEDEAIGGGGGTLEDANEWDTGHGSIEPPATNAILPTTENTLVTTLVERQVQTSGTVDWSLVSQQSGFTIQQCLEQSHCSKGKRLWTYTPGIEFDWTLAHSMHQFVVQFYPSPTPINFIAVSNFLWVSMADCLRIFDLLRGRIDWSPSTIETVRSLWAQGCNSALIARQLSPTLSAAALERQWMRIIGRGSLNHDVNPLIPKTIDDDSVAVVSAVISDHTARADPQVSAMIVDARESLAPVVDSAVVDQCVLALLSVHPLYDSRRTRRTRTLLPSGTHTSGTTPNSADT
ncbi:hypothetical protein GGH99_008097, partial [Coemansia sp. RSA 1285]